MHLARAPLFKLIRGEIWRQSPGACGALTMVICTAKLKLQLQLQLQDAAFERVKQFQNKNEFVVL